MPSYNWDWSDESDDFNWLFVRMMWDREVVGRRKGIQLVTKEEKPELFRDARVPLKRGGEPKEIAKIRFWEDRLRRLSETHPAHFITLHEIVEGQRADIPKRQLRDLKTWKFLRDDSSPLPDVNVVMKAGYRDSPDGPCIVDPFDTSSIDDATLLQLANEERQAVREKNFENFCNRLFDEDLGKDDGVGI